MFTPEPKSSSKNEIMGRGNFSYWILLAKKISIIVPFENNILYWQELGYIIQTSRQSIPIPRIFSSPENTNEFLNLSFCPFEEYSHRIAVSLYRLTMFYYLKHFSFADAYQPTGFPIANLPFLWKTIDFLGFTNIPDLHRYCENLAEKMLVTKSNSTWWVRYKRLISPCDRLFRRSRLRG